ncbi:MAG: hypothetical protein ITG01_09760 [Comamonas sp.]|nr:hypothetical protein [Comamonas sp.]
MVTTVYEPGSTAVGAATSQSGVSWAAIFAGALAAGVLSLLLFMLGIGLGLSSVSVWSGSGADGSTVGWGAVVWLVITQLASAAVGGYLAGRLRTKWQGVHTDEVYFRDTAHGFLAWALATIAMFVLAGSVVTSAISGAGKAAATVASTTATVVGGAVGTVGSAAGGAASAALSGVVGAATGQANSDGDLSYWISSMMRNGGPTEAQQQQAADAVENMADQAREVTREARSAAEDAQEIGSIFSQALRTGTLPEADADYVAQLIAQRTDLSQPEAKARVQKTFADVKQGIDEAKQTAKETQEKAMQAAEEARKATAHSMLWMFVALLMGAFVGSLSATYGGRQRDNF